MDLGQAFEAIKKLLFKIFLGGLLAKKTIYKTIPGRDICDYRHDKPRPGPDAEKLGCKNIGKHRKNMLTFTDVFW